MISDLPHVLYNPADRKNKKAHPIDAESIRLNEESIRKMRERVRKQKEQEKEGSFAEIISVTK